MSQQASVLSKVETYTYTEEVENESMEVLLIGVDASQIGSSNTFEPPGFDRRHITTWLRQRYFFLDGVVFAQVPRRLRNFPEPAREQFDYQDTFASDVVFEERFVRTYYPISETEAVCLEWDTSIDHWSMSEVTQPSEDGEIIENRGHVATSELFWTSP